MKLTLCLCQEDRRILDRGTRQNHRHMIVTRTSYP